MGNLSTPGSTELLYASWGEKPSIARPLMQGDVFSDVILPGLGNDLKIAQIVMHPCNMRRGASLVERITMIPVVPHRVQSSDWTKRYRIMPLPQLEGADAGDFIGNMTDFSSVPSASLDPAKRIAALSDEGVLILQQRLVFTQTRLLLSLDRFHEQMAPTFTELELQEEWAEEALSYTGSGSVPTGVVDAAAKQYQAWLDESDRARRNALMNAREHSRLRREAREYYSSLYAGDS
jgi:hypothetical protein